MNRSLCLWKCQKQSIPKRTYVYICDRHFIGKAWEEHFKTGFHHYGPHVYYDHGDISTASINSSK